jgi:hypothetical protein
MEDHATLRFQASGPIHVIVRAGASVVDRLAPRGEVSATVRGLRHAAATVVEVTAIDLAENERTDRILVETSGPLPRITITETRFDPIGPEPRQEYVELLNASDEPIDLRGFTLSDAPDRVGDLLEHSAVVPPNARALLVGHGFDPVHAADARVPPGSMITALPTSLANGGLANSGEPLFLRAPDGSRVSSAPREPPPRPGVCCVRRADDGSGETPVFGYDAAGGCTPGMPDRAPP